MGMFSKKTLKTVSETNGNADSEQETSRLTNSEKGGSESSFELAGTAGPLPRKTVAQVLGEVTWLMTQSPIHKQLFVADLEWFAMPAILLEQFRMFHGEAHPVGVALWARVSDETDKRLRDGAHKLRPDEWKGGKNAWLIELIAPFGGQSEMIDDLAAHVFPEEKFAYHHVTPEGIRKVAVRSPTGN